MAPRPAGSDSSDDEAPEAFSFGSSKKAAKSAQNELQQFQAAEKLKRKEKNRQKDLIKKERAAQAKSQAKKGKQVERPKKTRQASEDEESEAEEGGSVGGRDDLEARMEKAMRDAENESDEEEDFEMDEFQVGGSGSATRLDEEEGRSDEDGGDESQGEDEFEDMEGLEDEDEDMSEGEHFEEDEEASEGEPTRPQDTPNSRYLSDSLFATAFAKANAALSSKPKTKSLKKDAKLTSKKRKRTKRGPKDIVIGSRTIRTLAPTGANDAVASRTIVAPARVNKFLNRTLKLKEKPSDRKTRGWERKPANVGVMKRNGPAASFVRGS